MGTYTSTLVLTVTYTYNFASHLKSSFILMNESCRKQHIFRNIRFSVLETIKFSEFTPTYEHSSQSYYLGRWNHSRSIVSLLHLAQCTCWYKCKNLTIFILKCINDFNCYNRNVTENTCMKVVCLPYDNISVEIGYNKSFNKWMSYILFVCLFTYQYLSLDGSRFKKMTKH